MHVFAVILNEENEGMTDRINKTYPNNYEFSKTLFLVASDSIAETVATAVGIKGSDRIETGGVVFKLNRAYAGYTARALWDWLAQVEES